MRLGNVRSRHSNRNAVPSVMDLTLPKFADPADRPARSPHPWIVMTDSPALPAPVRWTSQDCVDHMRRTHNRRGALMSPSPCLNMDAFYSDESAGTGYMSVVPMCISDDSSTPANPDQVLLDDDLPTAVSAEDRWHVTNPNNPLQVLRAHGGSDSEPVTKGSGL